MGHVNKFVVSFVFFVGGSENPDGCTIHSTMFADTLMHLAVCAANSKTLTFEKVGWYLSHWRVLPFISTFFDSLTYFDMHSSPNS